VRPTLAFILGLGLCLTLAGPALQAQAPAIRPVTVGLPMPDFTLPAYQGGSVTLSSLKGKTIILIFPRGYSAPRSWCHVCNYQHQELVEYEATHQFRRQANVEILFVMPYARETIADWIDKYPQQLGDLEAYKNPPDPAKLDEAGRQRMERSRRIYPKSFKVTPGDVPTPFPLLMDADRAVSKGLGLFMTEWSGSKVDQNVPTVFVIDAAGIVKFKYFSQITTDRPPLDYLVKVVDWVKSTAPRFAAAERRLLPETWRSRVM
jgi:peroxiredoxin